MRLNPGIPYDTVTIDTFRVAGHDKGSRSSPRSQHPLWVHHLMDEAIESVWLSPKCPPASYAFAIFQHALHRQAKELGCAVPVVSASCLNRKIRRLDPYLVTRCRHGLAAARREFLARKPAVRPAK
jgi:hypothetical protein